MVKKWLKSINKHYKCTKRLNLDRFIGCLPQKYKNQILNLSLENNIQKTDLIILLIYKLINNDSYNYNKKFKDKISKLYNISNYKSIDITI